MTANFALYAIDASARITSSWPWYLTRASGLVAALLLTLLIISGIGMYTGIQFKIMAPLKSWANHRTLGIAFAISVAVHVTSLLFDKYINFSVAQILIPFLSSYKQIKLETISLGSLGVAFGIVALYLMTVVVYTSLTKIITKRPHLWKTTHYLSYLIVGLIFLHSIMLGTDLKNGIWRFIWIGINILILGFIGLRLRTVGALDK